MGKRLDFTKRQSQTTASETSSFKSSGCKQGRGCSGSPSAALPGWSGCGEPSPYVIYPLHTELSQRPARPVSTEDLSAAEWEHCASAAAVRNRVRRQQPSAAALFWQGALKLLTPLVASRRLNLCPPLAGRAFHRGLCCRRQGRKRLLNGKEARSHQQNKSKQGRALAMWP